ncbi:subtilase family protein, putative [Medicago truncatula]|uniref:Subtilase family protein, putative n=1 Tax=Medicago truncatula TaxID=3880 RepID=A0A072TMK1_MEDTR|nr:subtilase family protein, putative [Medicago truncatula]
MGLGSYLKKSGQIRTGRVRRVAPESATFPDAKKIADSTCLRGAPAAPSSSLILDPLQIGGGIMTRKIVRSWDLDRDFDNIASAIMTTSTIFDNAKEHIKDIGEGNKVATPLALGASYVDTTRALDPGLLYDVGAQDYVNLLYGLNFTQKHITTITRSTFNDCSKPSLDINHPFFIAFFNVYVANITPIKGFHVSVIPNKLVFHEKNEKLRFKLRNEVGSMTRLKKLDFGYLTWMDVSHVVRSPVVVTTLKFKS